MTVRAAWLDRAIEMREDGRSIAAIARILHRSASGLSWHFLVRGVDPPNHRRLSKTRRFDQMRNGRPVRRFTPQDDATLLGLRSAGMNSADIGRRLEPPRAPTSVRARLHTLARYEAHAEEESGEPLN